MNRRDFIKKASIMGALTTWTVTCKYEEKEHDPKGEKGEVGEAGYNWDYRVYCYERGQGEWTFSQNIRGSFAYQREYMTFEEDEGAPYAGWMDGGKLHFVTLEEAQDFVEMHVRAKDDTNLIDSIYDIYYVKRSVERVKGEDIYPETEIKVAHYWFNGDTGRQIEWVANKPYTDYSKIECA
mgnify:CR=1 FL=1|tara:strand:- start:686 stop:1228 length:543 start_codon:yes stop_codon:yes gene_type:complete